MGQLKRLTAKLLSEPQLMTAGEFKRVEDFFDERNSEDYRAHMAISGGKEKRREELAYMEDSRVGVLSVDGPLTYLEYAPVCGETPTSYQSLESQMKAFVKLGAKTVVMDTDSPGGEAYACFETAATLRKLADENGIKLVAYVDGLAASAAYGLVSAADVIIANPQAMVGSIGVVVSLTNTTKAEKAKGVERVYIHAGASKIPFNADGEFTEGFLDGIQERVDALWLDFINHVATMRGIEPKAIQAMEAKTFDAAAAEEKKLVDAVMTREEFFTYLADVAETGNTQMGIKSTLFNKPKGQDFDMNQLEQAQADLAATVAKLEEAEATITELSEAVATAATLQTELEKAKEQLTELAELKAKAEEDALAVKMQARKEKLSDVVGTEEADALFENLSGLPDAAFDSVVTSFARAKEALDTSPLFTEIGVGGDAEEEENPSLSMVGKLIKERQAK